MIRIQRNGESITIPAASLKKFIAAGWEPISSKVKKKPIQEEIESSKAEEAVEEPEEVEEVEEVEELQEEEDVEYVDPEELLDRPLNELDKDELYILAEYKGIDTSELRTIKQLRAAIRELG